MEAVKTPALNHDAMMLARFGHKVSANGKLERRVVANLLAHVRAAGFAPYSVHDGEEETAVDSDKAAMELIFNLDEAHVFVQKEGFGPHRILLVLGNGVDIVSDWTFSDPDRDGFSACMDGFDSEQFA